MRSFLFANSSSFLLVLTNTSRKLALCPYTWSIKKEYLPIEQNRLDLLVRTDLVWLTYGRGNNRTATHAKSVFAHLYVRAFNIWPVNRGNAIPMRLPGAKSEKCCELEMAYDATHERDFDPPKRKKRMCHNLRTQRKMLATRNRTSEDMGKPYQSARYVKTVRYIVKADQTNT